MVSKIVFSLLLLSIGLPLLAAAQTGKNLNPSDYQWKNRLLLIFSPSEELDLYQGQLQEMEGEQEGLNERDLKIFHLLAEGGSMAGEESLSSRDERQLRDTYDVPTEEFMIILIGKDGTEKLRTDSVLSVKKLFAVIDAMPMRRQEMKENKN